MEYWGAKGYVGPPSEIIGGLPPPHTHPAPPLPTPNHILKMSTDWKQNNIQDFIKIVYRVVKSDQDEICRAIRGTGDISLSENFLQHQVDIDRWSSMSIDQQTKATGKCLQDKGRAEGVGVGNQVTSSDGNPIIITTTSGGRKPHQTNRKNAEKYVTPAKRKIAIS